MGKNKTSSFVRRKKSPVRVAFLVVRQIFIFMVFLIPFVGMRTTNVNASSGLVQPVINATNVSTSPTLEVTATGSESGYGEVIFNGHVVSAGTGEEFTIIALPDTQYYSQDFPSIFLSQTQWIVNNKDALNIAYVAHLGDIVNLPESSVQWNNADAAMRLLENPATTGLPYGIPYGVVPGNHDIPTTQYNTYFGVSRFQNRSYYGGHYGSTNDSNYTFFSAAGMDFIVINLTYKPGTAVLNWADSLLKTYSSRRAIVVSHYILEIDDSWGFQAIYTALKNNPNLFLMLCGHNHTPTDGAARRQDPGDNGNIIYTLLADYQDFPEGGSGYLRILRFSPANGKIYVDTYSPTLKQYETVDPDNTFELDYGMQASPGCYTLTLSHTGQGSDPLASPLKSAACPANGQYVAGEAISLSGAAPAAGWQIGSWSGTSNNGSTANTNTLTMPASARTASVNYTEIPPACYSLTLSHTGQGSDPLASPLKSAACPANGLYVAGELISLSGAAPAAGWQIGSWSGTSNNGSTANTNTLTMPASTRTARVNYTQIVYTLAVNIVGSGSVSKDPDQASYHYGDEVKLSTMPAVGWVFAGWSGDLSGTTSQANITILSNMSVTVTFTELPPACYTLTLSHTGQGSDPLASPLKSAACPATNQYVAGEAISLSGAVPAAGWQIDGWSGTANDSSMAGTNTLTMPASARTASVNYTQIECVLTVNILGSGIVVISPEQVSYYVEDEVTLTAIPAAGWVFSYWSGSISNTTNPISIKITENISILAHFDRLVSKVFLPLVLSTPKNPVQNSGFDALRLFP